MDKCESFLTGQGLKVLKDAEKNNTKIMVKSFKASSIEYNFDDADSNLEYYYQADLSGYTHNDISVDFIIDIPPENAKEDAKFIAIFLEDSTPFMYAKPYGYLSKNKRQKTRVTLHYNNARDLIDFKYIPFAAAGKSLITEQGLKALAESTLTDQKLPLKYFKVTNKEYELSKKITDIDGWYENDINAFLPVDDNTIEFVVDVPPEKALCYGKTFALFLEDGTLFMLAKPPAPFPPLFRQIFRIQFVYDNANNAFDFKYIPFSDAEKVFTVIDNSVTKGLETNKLWEKMSKIEHFSSFAIDARENLKEVDSVKTRKNLNVYSKGEIDKKIKKFAEGKVDADKVDGKDVDDNKYDDSTLWTAAKINQRLTQNTIFCEYYKKKDSEKIKIGSLVKVDKNKELINAGFGESFIGVAVNKKELEKNTNLVLATEDKNNDSKYVLTAFTGFVEVVCLESVDPGDYITCSKWKGIGREAAISSGTSGFKRLLAVRCYEPHDVIEKKDKRSNEVKIKRVLALLM